MKVRRRRQRINNREEWKSSVKETTVLKEP
jgi:hypothetical protein